MRTWLLHHKRETTSTNIDARSGRDGDAFTADFQSAGRGRLNHTWEATRAENVLLSAVVSPSKKAISEISTLPLIAGLATRNAIASFLPRKTLTVKWPNDIYCSDKKIAGILCELHDEKVIIGIGVNVNQTSFLSTARATSIAVENGETIEVNCVRDKILSELSVTLTMWEENDFEIIRKKLLQHDFLLGKYVEVKQTDDDISPVCGVCQGIAQDGALIVGVTRVYAGEAHITSIE